MYQYNSLAIILGNSGHVLVTRERSLSTQRKYNAAGTAQQWFQDINFYIMWSSQ